ncbi:hypothetical protein H0H81_007011 [Sphagnurus paluster]|uniref:Uncharacterized protein n=1 Tax=Sphagnurus paluster TaxID=117069 RepID=A0A9P7FQD6_9AGAR|nr:hypothetical protein H0H81_007011 [Sphagnurus paluster]
MGNKKGKCKASSPAESNRPAPSRPVSPVYQAASRCDTPDQGYDNFQYYQEHLDDNSSSELEYQEAPTPAPPPQDPSVKIITGLQELAADEDYRRLHLPIFAKAILKLLAELQPTCFEEFLRSNKATQQLIAEAVSKAKSLANPPPPPPPTMEVDSPTTPTGPNPPGATPPTRGKFNPPAPQSGASALATPPTPPAAPTPHGKPASLRNSPVMSSRPAQVQCTTKTNSLFS